MVIKSLEEFVVEPLLLHVERPVDFSFGCLLHASLCRYSGHVPLGQGPGEDRIIILYWTGSVFGTELEGVSVEKEVWASLLGLLPPEASSG